MTSEPFKLPKVLDIGTLADYLSIDHETVEELLRRGRLPGFRVNGEWRFNQDVIDRWLESVRR